MQHYSAQPQPQRYCNLYFCNPGGYQVDLSVTFNFQGQSYFGQGQYNQGPFEMPLPQQQQPALEYGNACQPFTNASSGFCFPRPESSSSLLAESSYSSGLSTPGIVSDSWSYTTPQNFSHYPPGAPHMRGNVAYAKHQQKDFSFNDSFNPGRKADVFPSTSTPTKTGGCFPSKKSFCTIN